MRVYIAGAMTGKFDYKKCFIGAEKRLKELGHIVVNPAYLPEGLEDYFEINKAMIDQCDAIYVLRGYKNSVGTKKEIEYCKSKGWSREAGNIIYEDEDLVSDAYMGLDIGWGWYDGYSYTRDPYNPYSGSGCGLGWYRY